MKRSVNQTADNAGKWMGAGVLSAILASLCCITPVLALISGASGVASTFSWMEPARPYLLGVTILALAFAWFQKLKPKTKEQIDCACEADEKPSFFQSKIFLGMITIFAVLMLVFPNYAHIFYPSNNIREIVIVNVSDLQTVTFDLKGMTCNGCASHVENDVYKLPGIVSINASYKAATVIVEFDQNTIQLSRIEEVINNTGYKIIRKR